jgi:hypothetical protein
LVLASNFISGKSPFEIEGSISPLVSAPGTKDVEVVYSLAGSSYSSSFLNYDAHGDDGFGTPFRLEKDGTISWDKCTEIFI